jgi:hypothetical protein
MDGGHLAAALNGGASLVLTTLSETKFYFEGTRLEFLKNSQGAVTDLNIQAVEGDFKATRKK